MMNSIGRASIALVVSGVALAVVAQEKIAEGGLGKKLGPGMRLVSTLDTEFRVSDNFYYQESSKSSALGLILKPNLALTADHGRFRYSVGGGVESGSFDREGDRDDYVDHFIGGDVAWDLTGKQRLLGRAQSRRGHDPFGAVRSENAALMDRELDQWRHDLVEAEYRYGAAGSLLNLEFAARAEELTYVSNEAQTRPLNHHTDTLRGTGYYSLGPRTALVAEVIHAQISYDVAASALSRDGEQTTVRGGIRWLATGKTTGDVRVGKVYRDFDNPAVRSYDDFNWEAAVSWAFKPYSIFNFSTGWLSYEGYLDGVNFIETKYYGVQWRHDWSSRLSSFAGLRYDDSTFIGSATGRKDDTYNYQIGVDFNPSLTWSLYGRATSIQRDSTAVLRDYEENRLSLGVRITP